MLETELRPEQRTYAQAIAQSGEALLSLIGDILDFSKIESGTLTLEDEEAEVRALVEGVVELLSPRAHAKDIELVAFAAPDVPKAIRIDSIRLRQVLTNLVGNAVKFTEKGGVRIDVSMMTERERNFLRFEVRDTGVGVPDRKTQRDLRRIRTGRFQPRTQIRRHRTGACHLQTAGEGDGRRYRLSSGVPTAEVCSGSPFPPSVAEPAPEPSLPLAGKHVAVISRNTVLREGLVAQIRAAGGESPDLTEDGIRCSDIMLIDAGTGAEPQPPTGPLALDPFAGAV